SLALLSPALVASPRRACAAAHNLSLAKEYGIRSLSLKQTGEVRHIVAPPMSPPAAPRGRRRWIRLLIVAGLLLLAGWGLARQTCDDLPLATLRERWATGASKFVE